MLQTRHNHLNLTALVDTRYDRGNTGDVPLSPLNRFNAQEMTIPWVMKRTELVLKCLKGFMMEMGTWGTNRCSTIQLVVPEVRCLASHLRVRSSFSPHLESTRSDLLPIG